MIVIIIIVIVEVTLTQQQIKGIKCQKIKYIFLLLYSQLHRPYLTIIMILYIRNYGNRFKFIRNIINNYYLEVQDTAAILSYLMIGKSINFFI